MFGKNQAFYLMVIFLLIITVSNNFSQNSSLRGVVVDSQTKDPLPGANVILVGTSIGSATDIEGKFLIRNISSGQYKLKATYVGYDAKEMSVNLVAGKT
ncbi:MAG: carboxypeptidase-like regulatory domain-containing protein, partial [Ignavibacteriales bacterium]|nr:carboxypeptidase-like regulatory domain-containing protein [Ignavibacteriales bacterium]